MVNSAVVLQPEHWTRWTSFYSATQASYKYPPFLNNQDLSSGRKWNVPQQATQIECLLPHSCLHKLVKSFNTLRTGDADLRF